jgi:hypothetical protein
MIRTTLRFSAALAAAAVLAACGHLGIGTTNVADIKANPRAFEGKEVVIKGTVRDVTKLPMVDLKSYVVADATGDITVTTKSNPPATGEKLVVRGEVSSAAIVGGHSFGVHVAERDRSNSF